jgi:tetratricopeptide (TPR) repeat protein
MDYGLMEFAGRTGAPIRGTLAYLAPEVVRRATVDQRADLYAAGALAYELWCGQPPFVKAKPLDVLRAQVEERPQPLRRHRAGLDPDLERLVLRLLAKDPLERPQSAYEALAEMGLAGDEAGGTRLLTSAMVGREAELTALGKLRERVAAGEPGALVALWGPPGVGKSRLVEEFRFEVQLANMPVAASPNHEFAQSPYGPVVRLLRGLMPAFKAHVRADLDRHASVLAKVLPELGVTPAPELDPPSTEKMRLQSVMADMLLALARAAGLVLVLEDWHWADPLSDQFLDYLARNMVDAPLLLIVTSHQDPTGPAGWRERATGLPLGGLAPDAVGRVMASMLGMAEVDAALVARMARLSEGNPYMVEMILEHAVQIGALTRDRGKWSFTEPPDADALPQDLRALQALKLERLDASARQLARTASAVGYAFDLSLLKRVTALDEEALFQAVDALVAHHVFVETEEGVYRFARDQLQDVLYNSLDPAEREAMHTAIARAMEAAASASPDADVPLDALTMIADQYMRGTLPEKTIAYCLLAGVRHARLFATDDAARYLEGGLALLQAQGEQRWRRAKLDYLAHLGDVRRLLGEYDAGRAHYEAAVPLAQLLEDRYRECRMWISLAKIHQATQRFPEALAAAEKGIAIAEAIDDAGEAARGLMTSGRVRYFDGDVAGAIADHERARTTAERGRDPAKAHLASAFLGYLLVAALPERAEEGMRLMADAIEYLEAIGDKVGLNNTFDFLGNAQIAYGDARAARATFARKLAICREIGYRDEEAVARVNLASAALRLGAYREAAGEAEVAAERGSFLPLACAKAYGGLALAALGDAGGGLALAREGLAIARGRRHRYLESVVLPSYLDLLMYLGRVDDAAAEAEALGTLIAETGHAEAVPALAVVRAELAARLGRTEEAAASAATAVAGATHLGARGLEARGRVLQARLALEAGRWEDVGPLLQAARSLVDALDLAPLRADLDLVAGDHALAVARPEPAAAHFAAALATAEAMGAPLDRALARFGLAAAHPYTAEAPAHARAAREGLEGLVAGLAEPDRAAFLAYPERRRAWEGNYVGHSLPHRSGGEQAKPAPLPLAEDLWKRL